MEETEGQIITCLLSILGQCGLGLSVLTSGWTKMDATRGLNYLMEVIAEIEERGDRKGRKE